MQAASAAMTLHVRYSSSIDVLADELAEQLATPPADPFEPIVVAVPTAGIRDWLTRRLADRLGVAANIAMPFPGRFLAAALGTPLDADDPWEVDRLAWAVLDVLDSGAVDVPGSGGALSRRFAMARRIADLFDRYATTRPQILQQWSRGIAGDGTVGAAVAGDDDGDDIVRGIDPASTWQFELWQAVRGRVGSASPAERLPDLARDLRGGTLQPALPSVVAMFGIGALALTQLEVVTALAAVRDVTLSVVTPSTSRWSRAAPVDPARLVSRRVYDECASGEAGHPLIDSWGRLGVETAALLRGAEHSRPVPGHDDDANTPPDTLLAHVQRDIRLDRPPTTYAGPPEYTSRLASLQVHACHGATRQLEVLRDVLGHLFTADESLRPADVLVLCADIGRFEPFAHAVFQRGAFPVPVKVSDLSLGAENPIAAALAAIVAAVADRCTTADVLAVAALDPVREKLGITVDDLATFATWTDRLGTTWGLDTEHRRGWLGVEIDSGTWESALDSLLLGAAVPAPTSRRAFADIVPHDDVGGGDLVAAGKLAELVARLRQVRAATAGTGPIDHWRGVLVDVLGLLCAARRDDAWQMSEVLHEIDRLAELASVGGALVDAPLDWADVRVVVDGLVRRAPGRLSLRSGRVTMTGMVPLRNVPAKVVCLLGFDEVSLRPPTVDGDDLLAVRPCVGERDRRREQRQLVLDAVMAAQQHLVVVCDGSDITTNRPLRFPVQLVELLDVVHASVGTAGRPEGTTNADELSSPVLVRHRRRTFDERLFGGGDPHGRAVEPFSFDHTMLAAATARRGAHDGDGAPTPLRWSIDAPIPPTVTLAELAEACTRPARTLLRDALDVRLPRQVEAGDHHIPLSITPLDAAGCGRRLLEAYAALGAVGPDRFAAEAPGVVAAWSDVERLRAGAPPGRLIEHSLDDISSELASMIAALDWSGLDVTPDAIVGAGATVDVDVTLRYRGRAVPSTPGDVGLIGALRLVDTVRGVVGGTVGRLEYRRPKRRVLVGAALDLAALVAATDSTEWRGVTVMRGASGEPNPHCHVLAVSGDVDHAHRLLDVAAELRVAALRGAVPVFEESSFAMHHGEFDEETLFGNEYLQGDLADDETRFVWGSTTLPEVMTLSPSPLELASMLWGSVEAFVTIEKLKAPRRPRAARP